MENINWNDYDFRITFALSTNVCIWRRYVVVWQYLKKQCKNYVLFERDDYLAEIFKGSYLRDQLTILHNMLNVLNR